MNLRLLLGTQLEQNKFFLLFDIDQGDLKKFSLDAF